MSADRFPRVHTDATMQLAAGDGVSRRTFNRAALASLGTLALGSLPVLGKAAKGGGGGGGGGKGGGGGGSATRNALYTPPTVTPTGTVPYPLTAAPAKVNLGGGESAVLAYNKRMPGPTFRAQKGDKVNILFTNSLTQESTVHWHGMIVESRVDGHPIDAVSALGGTYIYDYEIKQRAALNWYHPHPHMLTGEQVCLGLAGAFIINDDEEAALNLPSGDYEVPLIIRDANFDKSGNLIYNPRTTGFNGNTPLVNGTRNPFLEVDPAVYRFRVLNGANGRLFRIALSSGGFIVIGNDGGLLAAPANETEILFGPGERLDLLVDFGGVKSSVMLRDLDTGWDLLEFRVKNGTSSGTIPSGALSKVDPLPAPVTTRFFSFDGMSKINGQLYDLNRIDFTVPFGQTERWVFTTNGNAPHPIHVHGASFQVQSRTGGRGKVFSWEGGWKDTVLLLDRETVEVLIRFDQYTGRYLLHCHKLEHEDMGMMANFVVGPSTTLSPFRSR